MHILTHNTTGEKSLKVPINTTFPNIVFNDSNYNNITIHLDDILQVKDENHEFLISISTFQIPISWFIISSYIGNNIFEYIVNSVTYSYIIPDGSYSANDLKSLFNSNIQLTVTYSKTTGKFIFTHSTYEFSITSNTTCYYEIGFKNEVYTSSSLILNSSRPIDLSGTKSIYIRSNLSTENIDRNGRKSNIIDIVPIDVNNFDILRYKNQDGFRTKINNKIICDINIILEDDRGRKIDINNDWEIVIEFNKIINNNYPVINEKTKPDIEDIEEDI